MESEGSEDSESYIDRRAILEPVVRRVVDALGGHEQGVYRLGDEVYGCLKDLKKLWRKDDTDDERTVARIFWETRVLPNDLVPILLATAGKGLVEDKRAIACVDLMTAMTWPIDMAEELKELDEQLDKGTDYTQLLQSHLNYKAALLKPGVMQALFGIMLPPLAKPPKQRVERDGQIINVALHLIRNMAFIKDLTPNIHLSADQLEYSGLQSKLIRALSETHTLELLLTIASNTVNDPLVNGWNTLVLEIFYLLFRGVKPTSLTADQKKQPAENLQRLLAAEERTRRDLSRKASSRHSRFGTTISVKLNPNKKSQNGVVKDEFVDKGNEADSEHGQAGTQAFVLHRQQAISREAGSIMDMTKKQKSRGRNPKEDELMRQDNLSVEAKILLQGLAGEFLEACFNPFLAGLLKDIKSERAKISEKDNLRLLFVTKWFLEFFLLMRSKEKAGTPEGERKWGFSIIAEVTERGWIIWVLKRMREAVEEKPKLWTELQAGIECLTQLLVLIDNMSMAEIADPVLNEAAEVLQQQLIYNGEVLDIAFESLRGYKLGTQSLKYLDSSVGLAYALMKMLEKWSGGGKGGRDTYVRQKKKVRRKAKGKGMSEGDGIPDVEEEEEMEPEELIHETMFTFEAFEMKFAHAEITHTLLIYLARYREFDSSENVKRVVSLMHRQVVRAKAEGLYFNVSTLDLFKTILADQKTFPREQPYKDLVGLINFILRRFFKALAEDSFLAIEAFFPKNRGHWKQFSSWQPEEKSKREKRTVEDTRFPQEVQVKKGYSWSEQLGIVIAALVEGGQAELVGWTKDILTVVIAQRQRIIDDIDAKEDDTVDEREDVDAILKLQAPSTDALAKLTDYLIPYLSDEQADAATKNPQLKLLFRLAKFFILDEDADELEWYVPAGITPSDLRSTLAVIDQFLETPIDLEGKSPSQLLGKKTRRRRRRSPSPDSDLDVVLNDDEPRTKKKKEKKKKEKEQYKSAQFIEDSDEEYGDIEAFLEKEKGLRAKAALAAAADGGGRIGTMKATGTKKRRRKVGDKNPGNKKRKGDDESAILPEGLTKDDESQHDSELEMDTEPVNTSRSPSTGQATTPNSRPRPKPRIKSRPSDIIPSSPQMADPKQLEAGDPEITGDPSISGPENGLDSERAVTPELVEPKRRNRLVISDSDSD